jgi:hypothetical protein
MAAPVDTTRRAAWIGAGACMLLGVMQLWLGFVGPDGWRTYAGVSSTFLAVLNLTLAPLASTPAPERGRWRSVQVFLGFAVFAFFLLSALSYSRQASVSQRRLGGISFVRSLEAFGATAFHVACDPNV